LANTPEKKRERTNWRPIVPVPKDAPEPRLVHPVRGEPIATHVYRDAEGNLLGYVCRFIRSAGGVHNLALTYCVNEEDKYTAWKWIQFRKFRPIYGAEHLDPERRNIVLIVGDEQAVDAIRVRKVVFGAADKQRGYFEIKKMIDEGTPPGDPFLIYDLVSWPGGRSKLGEVDWSPLKGRICSIWLPHSAEHFKVARGDPQTGDMVPIEKQPWRVAARQLQETLRAFGAVPISIVEAATTEELPDGWDPVMALDSGWPFEKLGAWCQEHFASAEDLDEARRLATGSLTPPAAAPKPEDPAWMRSLLRKEGTGPLLPELHNITSVLSKHEKWKGVIYLDDLRARGDEGEAAALRRRRDGRVARHDDSMTSTGSRRVRHPQAEESLVAEAVQTVAKLARNPLVEYLNGLKWDGTPRLDTWLKDYCAPGPRTPI
jgi:putative DNA primase/helicase